MNSKKEVVEVYLDDIIPNRFQPRLKFDETELNNLADSIKEHGVIQPLILRKLNNKYEIIAGERRYKASVIAGLTKVPAIIEEVDDNKSAELAIVENLQRKDLSAIEEAKSFKKLLDKGYLNQEGLAKKMGVSQPTIANKLRLLNLTDEVQQALLDNRISERHARSLLAVKDPTDQVLMLHKIINNRLTVKQTDQEIKRIFGDENQSTNIESSPIENISEFLEVSNKSDEEKEKPKNDIEEIKDINNDYKTNNDNKEEFDINDLLRVEEPKKYEIKEKNIESNDNIKEIKNEEPKLDENFENQLNPFQEFEISDDEPEKKREVSEIDTLKEDIKPKKSKLKEKNLMSAINLTRDAIKEIEDNGFEVNTEEFDFEDMYQIIIKIEK